MKLLQVLGTILMVWIGHASAQSKDQLLEPWRDFIEPNGSLFRAQPGCKCGLPDFGHNNDVYVQPGYWPNLDGGYIAAYPRYRHDSDGSEIQFATPSTDLSVHGTTSCILARKELLNATNRFSLCNVTPTSVEVSIDKISDDHSHGALKIVLGPGSFVSIHAEIAQSQISIRGGVASYLVTNGLVYSLEASTSGLVTLNEYAPETP